MCCSLFDEFIGKLDFIIFKWNHVYKTLQHPRYILKESTLGHVLSHRDKRWTLLSSTASHWSTHIHCRCRPSVVFSCWSCSPLQHCNRDCLHFGSPGKEQGWITMQSMTEMKTSKNVLLKKTVIYYFDLRRKYLCVEFGGIRKSCRRLWKTEGNPPFYHVSFNKYTIYSTENTSYLYKGSFFRCLSHTLRKPVKHLEWW